MSQAESVDLNACDRSAFRLLCGIFERATQEILVFRSGGGQLELANHAACMNLGYSRDGLLCKSIGDVCQDLSPAGLEKIRQELDENGSFVSLETSLRRRIGTRYPVSARLEYADKSAMPLIAMYISDNSQSAVASRHLEFANHAGNHCFSCMNLDTLEIQRDPALDRLYGFGTFEPQRTARDFIELVLPEYRDEVREQFVALSLGTIDEIDHVFPISTATGELKWIRGIGRLSDHDPRMIVGMQTDVTELREFRERERAHEAAISEIANERDNSEKELRNLLALLPDAVSRATPDTVLNFVNERYCDFLGLREEDLIGRSFFDFIPQAARDLVRRSLATLGPQNPMVTFEQPMKTVAGDLWFLWSNLMLFDHKGEPAEIISVGRDITELVATRRQLDANNALLEKKNRALEKFSATVAHDLKQPLRNITLFAEMIAKDIAGERSQRAECNARQIVKISESMTGLISGLLDYSQIAYANVASEPVDLNEVVEDAKRLLWTAIDECGATVKADELPVVTGDKELLLRLFQNVIGNAVKYRKPDVAPEITIDCDWGLHTTTIGIADNSIGIDPCNEEWIFGMFQHLHQGDDAYSGSGIGLALARQIAESHGGSLVLDGEYRNGARFVFTLANAEADESANK